MDKFIYNKVQCGNMVMGCKDRTGKVIWCGDCPITCLMFKEAIENLQKYINEEAI
jgi:hypothetical protein